MKKRICLQEDILEKLRPRIQIYGAAAAEKPIPRKIGQKFGTLAGPASSRDLIGRKSGPNRQS
ncbi:hypothetical protein CSKR_113283 [Clonorchis sinensis]|uniref:Uncharacterized protein n=1 Tax=Clonorchis sinensis TaxID=79923 RepID=A0A419PGD9_CLOSI|nr:hypothetical protein CSKR_113283 [Clonorchis sinensis]